MTAALLVALSVALLVPGRSDRQWQPPRPNRAVGAGVIAAVALAVLALDGRSLVLGLLAVAVTGFVARGFIERRSRAVAEARRAAVLSACEGLAADLAAGQPPTAALAAAAEEWSDLGPAAAAADLDADVPAALRQIARRPGSERLADVAAAWQVAHRSGAGLSPTLTDIADDLRAHALVRRTVATELAAARATARLLAVLPVPVLFLSQGIGGSPVRFLVGSTAGLVCLGLGIGLAMLGLVWIERIAAQAEP